MHLAVLFLSLQTNSFLNFQLSVMCSETDMKSQMCYLEIHQGLANFPFKANTY